MDINGKRRIEREKRWKNLMLNAQSGNKKSYDTLLREISPFIFNYLKRFLKDISLREDLLQEILLSLHISMHTFDGKRQFIPWMMAITRYRAIDHIRKWARTLKHEIHGDAIFKQIGVTNFLISTNTEMELDDELVGAIKKLSDKQRLSLELLKIKGFTVAEAAQKTGWSKSDIKVSVYRGIKKIRTIFLKAKV